MKYDCCITLETAAKKGQNLLKYPIILFFCSTSYFNKEKAG